MRIGLYTDDQLVNAVCVQRFAMCRNAEEQSKCLNDETPKITRHTRKLLRHIKSGKVNAAMSDEQICGFVLPAVIISWFISQVEWYAMKTLVLWIIERVRFLIWK